MKKLVVIATLILFSSCGGGGGGGGGSGSSASVPAVPNAATGGIWQGRDPFSGADILGLVAEDGRSQFVVFDALPFTQYWGTLAPSGNTLTASTFQAADEFTYYGSATLTGTINARQSMTVTVAFTPAAGCAPAVCGSSRTGTGTFTFNTLYNRGGALSRVIGNWQDVATGQIYNINSSGVVFNQSAVTGCVINGQVSTINTTYNAYAVNFTYSSCRSPYAIWNGTQASGLVTVDDTVTPNRIYLGAQYRSGGVTYATYGEAVKR